MAAGISIGVAADTRVFSQGVKNGVVQPLEDVEKALDKVDSASEKAGNELEQAMKGAQAETKELGQDFEKMSDKVRAEAKKAGRAIDTEMKDGSKDAGHAVQGFKEEAIQNFAEVSSSFDGSIEGAVDGVQGTLGGLATSIGGPLGLAFAGVGLVAGAAFNGMQEDAEETKEVIRAAFDDMTESGKAYASEEFINDSMRDIISDTEKLKGIQADANSLGLELSTTLRAQSGDQAALNEVNQAAMEKLDGVNERKANLSKIGAPIPGELQAEATAAEDLLGKYAHLADNLSTAAGQAAVFRDAQVGSASSTSIAKGKVDEYNNAVAAIQTQKSLNVDVSGIAAAEAQLAQLARNRTVTINVNGDITRIGNQVW